MARQGGFNNKLGIVFVFQSANIHFNFYLQF